MMGEFFSATRNRSSLKRKAASAAASLPSCSICASTRADHRGQQLQKIGAFDQVIPRPAFHHLDRHPFIALSGDDEERGQTLQVGELADDLAGVEVLKFQIQQKQIRLAGLQPGDGFRAGGGGGDGKALPFQRLGRQTQQAAIIIHNQERRGWFGLRSCSGQARTSGTCTRAMNRPNCLIASANLS